MFEAIGNAVAVLTDPEKRKQYDMYGADEDKISSQGMSRNGDNHYHNFTRGFEGDKSANIIAYIIILFFIVVFLRSLRKTV